MAETCATCRFYFHLSSVCRKRTPQAFIVGMTQTGDAIQITAFPKLKPAEWCGEYEKDPLIVDDAPRGD